MSSDDRHTARDYAWGDFTGQERPARAPKPGGAKEQPPEAGDAKAKPPEAGDAKAKAPKAGDAKAPKGGAPGKGEAPAKGAPSRKPRPGKFDGNDFQLLTIGEPEVDPRQMAQQQAVEMVETAQAQAEGIERQAYEEGYQKGYQQGQEEGLMASKARVEAASQNLERLITALDKAKSNVLAGLETEVIALVQAVADGLMLTDQAFRPRLIQSVVSTALAQVRDAHQITVRLSATDMESIREFRPALEQNLANLDRLEIIADPELGAGDCLVDAADTHVDASLSTRRRAIFKSLEETLRQGPPLDVDTLSAQDPPPPVSPASHAGDAEAADAFAADESPAEAEAPDASAETADDGLEDW